MTMTFSAEDASKQKSQSSRLRNVFYILYNQDNEGFLTFDLYYQTKMENLISDLKSKIKGEK